MWKVDKPQRTARWSYTHCIATVGDAALKARLELIEDDVADASDEFEAAAITATLHTIQPANHVGSVTRKELADLYTNRFAKAKSRGRVIYDELMIAPAYARCPLCGHRQVSTLDHHLPKSRYPALAVAPLNLIPTCMDCNQAKLERVPHSSADETLHPYFDDVEDDEWLHAAVIQGDRAAVVFYPELPAAWDGVMAARVVGHFGVFGLARLYGAQAAVELENIRFHLEKLLMEAGPAGVRAHLIVVAESCEQASVNSWRTAMYKALAASDWFVAGGFA
jgi:5-methylcytosine-specific restriction endonuclease McrA